MLGNESGALIAVPEDPSCASASQGAASEGPPGDGDDTPVDPNLFNIDVLNNSDGYEYSQIGPQTIEDFLKHYALDKKYLPTGFEVLGITRMHGGELLPNQIIQEHEALAEVTSQMVLTLGMISTLTLSEWKAAAGWISEIWIG